ncbi:MAG: efflux RND transporter periplasmic adaptor subunit [Bacteroidota bacterium]
MTIASNEPPRHSLLLILIGIGLLLSSCGEKEAMEVKFLRPVKYEVVSYGQKKNVRSFSGTAQTDVVVQLSFRSSGIITLFNVKLGQRVRKGQLLGQLDNVQARLAYEQAVTQLNSTESQMNTAKLSLNRIRSLYEKGSAALGEFEAAKNAYRTAQEGFRSAQRGVDIQQEQVRFGFLYAPDDGIISSVLAEKDENVSPGQPVAVLNAGEGMEIVIGIPESVINSVAKGMEATASFSSIPDESFAATVTEVAPSVDGNTATYPVRLSVSRSAGKIKSGMAARVSFDFSDKTEANAQSLIIPIKAVGEDSDGQFVLLIDQSQDTAMIKKQHIEIGELNETGFVVKSGISAGQKIATAGLQTLLDGQRVRVE